MNNGGPAFPVPSNEHYSASVLHAIGYSGMTLRQWYAGQALTGLMARLGPAQIVDGEDIVGDAFAVADAMLTFEQYR